MQIENVEAMHSFWKQLASEHNKILLHGEMGAGKTTLAQALVETRWVDPTLVQSPTYTYIQIYDEKVLHIDMRRILSEEQFLHLWILELIDSYDYVIIERPKREKHYTTTARKTIRIEKNWEQRIVYNHV